MHFFIYLKEDPLVQTLSTFPMHYLHAIGTQYFYLQTATLIYFLLHTTSYSYQQFSILILVSNSILGLTKWQWLSSIQYSSS